MARVPRRYSNSPRHDDYHHGDETPDQRAERARLADLANETLRAALAAAIAAPTAAHPRMWITNADGSTVCPHRDLTVCDGCRVAFAAELVEVAGAVYFDPTGDIRAMMAEPIGCATLDCTAATRTAGSTYCDDCNGLTEPDDGMVLIAGVLYDAETLDEAEPWSDEDTDELARAMAAAADDRRARWAAARWNARAERADRIAREGLTRGELATAAARFGIVAASYALPLSNVRAVAALRAAGNDASALVIHEAAARAEATERQRSAGDIFAAARTARRGHTTFELDSVGLDQRYDQRRAIENGTADRWPINGYDPRES